LAAAAAAVVAVELLLRGLGLPASTGYLDASDARNLAEWSERTGREGVLMAGQAHHPRYGWTNPAGLRDFVEPGHPPRSTNAAGLRGEREYVRESRAGLRIALVGDSFTFGTHQADGRIWAAALERALAPGEVLNFGVPGYGIDQALLRLEDEALGWRPQVVVFAIFATNPQRATRRFTFYAKPRFELAAGGGLAPEPIGIPIPAAPELAADPRAWLATAPSRLRLLEVLRGSRAEGPPVVPLTEAILERAAERCRDAGARLLLLRIPTLRWREQPPAAWEAAAEAVAARHAHVEGLDLRTVFAASDVERIYIPGRHFSAAGHGLVAEGLEARLRELGWWDAELSVGGDPPR
ncbi:MAG: SGNH/GDSL hydrolase family protein, partial [Planctomycetota bacterium]